MLSKLFLPVALLAAKAAATIFYAGVAESGGEFGVYSATGVVGTGLPGEYGVTYQFIDESTVDIYVDDNHINLFRVAFLLERICPVAGGLGAVFNETYYGELEAAINYITVTKGVYAILDPHNYMRYNNPSQQPTTGSVIGNTSDVTAATTAQFAAFWGELAGRFVSNEKVIFGLMNEPHDMNTTLILANDQAAINAIRATGAQQLILAPGNGYTGGHSWTESWTGNAPASSTVMWQIYDPINNTAFDIHEYLDVDFSGSHSDCVSLASTYLAPLTAWLEEYGFKAMITEFGAANGTECDSYVVDIINYMADNDVYIGWTAWAAGPLWGTYSPCCANYGTWGSLEPGSLASDGTPGMYTGVWVDEIQPLLPTTLQTAGLSNLNGPAGLSSSSSSTSTSTTSSKTSTSTTSTTSTKSSTTTTTSSTSKTTSTSTTKTTSSITTTSTVNTALQSEWGQCGGSSYSGPTICSTPWVCSTLNPWYAQCTPAA